MSDSPDSPEAPEVISTVAEYHACIEHSRACGEPLVVQFSTARCARCPAFTDALRSISNEYHFRWCISHIDRQGDELAEHLEALHQLPAIAFLPGSSERAEVAKVAEQDDDKQPSDPERDVALLQSCTPDAAYFFLSSKCRPKLQLDDDF